MSKETASASASPSFDQEKFKTEMAEQTRTILREMMVEMSSVRQEPLAPPPVPAPIPPPQPFDINAEDLGRQQLDDDQETVLAEPVIRQKVDVPESKEKPEWAKDLVKSMAQMQLQMKEKGIDSPINYSDLSLGEDDDPLPQKFKFPDMKKFTGIEDPYLHLKQYATHIRTTSLNRSQIVK